MLDAHRVAVLENTMLTAFVLAGGGYVLVIRDDTSRWIYRLSDGARSLMTTEALMTYDYAGPEEFAGGPWGTSAAPYGVPYLDFVRYDSFTYAP